MKKWICLILTIGMLCTVLSGCFSIDDLNALLRGGRDTAFADMEYTRPDMDALREAFQAVEDAAPKAKKVTELMDLVYDAYELYYNFATAYSLAQIHYSADLTQENWAEENEFCSDAASEVDALLDQMLYTLAACPLKDKLENDRYFGEGFFDDYEGESLWDETFTDLMDQDSALQVQFYALSEAALESSSYQEYFDVYGTQMADVYVEMVKLRQQIAAYAGYDSYPEFAYDFQFGRDYTPAQAGSMLAQIRDLLVPLYRQASFSDAWDLVNQYCSEKTVLAYVENVAGTLGGKVQDAFDLMEKFGLYDLAYSENKFDASFTVYLIDYEEPYIFINPTRGAPDKLTFTHEFGHFCNGFASYGNMPSVDIAEVFSQGLEYLSLCCGDTGKLEQYKLADCLSVYVEQAAFAAFEEAVYTTENPTRESVCRLFSDTMADYGMDIWDISPLGFVQISHFFTQPMYILSYVVSNDAAFQLYQLEKQEAGKGIGLYLSNLDTEESDFLTFVEQAGLESPFAEGRMASVKATLESILAQ